VRGDKNEGGNQEGLSCSSIMRRDLEVLPHHPGLSAAVLGPGSPPVYPGAMMMMGMGVQEAVVPNIGAGPRMVPPYGAAPIPPVPPSLYPPGQASMPDLAGDTKLPGQATDEGGSVAEENAQQNGARFPIGRHIDRQRRNAPARPGAFVKQNFEDAGEG
jgi:hypothetical protein